MTDILTELQQRLQQVVDDQAALMDAVQATLLTIELMQIGIELEASKSNVEV